jgi:hypothetical protein
MTIARRILTATVLVVIVIAALAVWMNRLWSFDSRITLQNLKGLTPTQVANQLGPPNVDPRLPRFGGWSTSQEATVGPLVLYYHGPMGQEYAIVFTNGQVSDVKVGRK